MANNVDIDSLTLQITASTNGAAAAISSITRALNGLNTALSGVAGLANVAQQLRSLSTALNGVNFSNTNFQGLQDAARAIRSAANAANALNGVDVTGAGAQLTALGNALVGLNAIPNPAGLRQALNTLQRLPNIIQALNGINMRQVATMLHQLGNALGPLAGIENAQGFTHTINALARLPQLAQQLEHMNIAQFAHQMEELAVALQPLAVTVNDIAAGFNRLPQRFQALANVTASASMGMGRFGFMLQRVFSIHVAYRVGRTIASWVKLSTEYVEDLNLFTVAMGKYADKAQEYAEKVSDVMGIDPAQWMRAQGIFETLATGFGVSADRAAVMSKNLTQLAYDISSFYNLDIDKAMQKLESGFAGEIEPVRRLGYDLSKTTLQATAASLGITKLFADMTQAEKSQLRYYAMMTQVTQVQGDMARTLQAPANQLRILTAQLEMAKRAIGNAFIPAINAALPYLIAFFRLIRLVADGVARFFGFELPEIDYSGISMGVGEVDDAMEDLDDSTGRTYNRAKKLKNLLASFDELNIIQSETGGGSGIGSGGTINGLDGWKDFELPEYDFLGNILGSKADAIFDRWKKKLRPFLHWVKENFDIILDVIKAIGLGLIGWKVGSDIAKLLGLGPKIGAGIGLSIAGFSLEFSGARAIGAGNAKLWDYIKTALGSALGIAGSLIIFGTSPEGWIIGIAAALAVFIAGIRIGYQDRLSESLDAQFKEIFQGTLDPDEYARIVQGKFDAITGKLGNGLELKGKVDMSLDGMDDALLTISNYRLKLEGTGQLTTDEMEQVNAAFLSLKNEGADYIQYSFEMLQDGLISALRILPDEARDAVTGYLSELGVLKDNAQNKMEEYTSRMEEAFGRMMEAVPGSDEFNDALQEYTQAETAVGLMTGRLLDSNSAFATALANANADLGNVNFDSMDSVVSYLGNVSDAYQAAKEKVGEYWGAEINEAANGLAAAQRMNDEQGIAFYSGLLETYREAQREQNRQIDELYQEETLPLIERLAQQGMGIWDHALEEYEGMNFFQRLIAGGEEGHFGAEVDQYYRDYLKPLIDELVSRGVPGMEDAAKNLEQAYFDNILPKATNGTLTQEEWAAFLQGLESTLTGFDTEFAAAGAALGISATEGFQEGISDLNGIAEDAGKAGGGAFISGVRGMRNMFADVGTNFGDAFGANVVGAVEAQTNNLGRRMRVWWQSISGSAEPRVHGATFDFGSLDIPAFASGGLPSAGSLFLAGEGGGAELVGSMGNQTAVANGDQIVSGIAYGVQMANASEERLIRELLGYVRQIAQNGGNVVFSPSPEAGRAVQYALNMYQTQRGY